MHFLPFEGHITSFLCETHLREIRETHSGKSGKVILESQVKSGKVREFELKSFVYTLLRLIFCLPLPLWPQHVVNEGENSKIVESKVRTKRAKICRLFEKYIVFVGILCNFKILELLENP